MWMVNASTFHFTIEQTDCSDSDIYSYAVFENGHDIVCRRYLADVKVEEKDISCTFLFQHTGQNFELNCKAVNQSGNDIDFINFADHNGLRKQGVRRPTIGAGCLNATFTITDIINVHALLSDDRDQLYCVVDDSRKCKFSLEMEPNIIIIDEIKTQLIQFTCYSPEKGIPDVWWFDMTEPFYHEDRSDHNRKQIAIICGKDRGDETLTFGGVKLIFESDSSSILPLTAEIIGKATDRHDPVVDSHDMFSHVINISMSTPLWQAESESIRKSKLVLDTDLPVCHHMTINTKYGYYMIEGETENSIQLERGDDIFIFTYIQNVTFDDNAIALLHSTDGKVLPCYMLQTGQCWNKLSDRHFVRVSNTSKENIKVELNISSSKIKDSGSYMLEISLYNGTSCRVPIANISVIETSPDCSANFLRDVKEVRLSCKWQPLTANDVILLSYNNQTLYRSEYDDTTTAIRYYNTSKNITSDASLDDIFRRNRVPNRCTISQFGYEKSCQLYNFIYKVLTPTAVTPISNNVWRLTIPCCTKNGISEGIWLYKKNNKGLYRVDISPQSFTEWLTDNCNNIEIHFICGKEVDGGLRVHTVANFALDSTKFIDTARMVNTLLEISVTSLQLESTNCEHKYKIVVLAHKGETKTPTEAPKGYASPNLSLSTCPTLNTPCTESAFTNMPLLGPVPEPILITALSISLLAIIFVLIKIYMRFVGCNEYSFPWKARNTTGGSHEAQLTGSRPEIIPQSAASIPLQIQQPSQSVRGLPIDRSCQQEFPFNDHARTTDLQSALGGPDLPSRPYHPRLAQDAHVQLGGRVYEDAEISEQTVTEAGYSEYSMTTETPTNKTVAATKENIYCYVDDIDDKIGHERNESHTPSMNRPLASAVQPSLSVTINHDDQMRANPTAALLEEDNGVLHNKITDAFPDHLYAKADKSVTEEDTRSHHTRVKDKTSQSDNLSDKSDTMFPMYAKPDKCKISEFPPTATDTDTNSIIFGHGSACYKEPDNGRNVSTDQNLNLTKLHLPFDYDINAILTDSDYDALKFHDKNYHVCEGDRTELHLNPLSLGEASDEIDIISNGGENLMPGYPVSPDDINTPGNPTDTMNYDNLQRQFVLTRNGATCPILSSFQPDGYDTLQHMFPESLCPGDTES